jgi:Uma2 family endonuclease
MSKPQLFITDADADVELSAAEYAEADFRPPWKYERAHRRIVVIPPPGHYHHVITGVIRSHLGAYQLAHPDIVEFVFQESWLRVDEDTDRHPDITVYLLANSPGEEILTRVPDIVFEVVSPGRPAHDRDYVSKRNEYETAGVREYVIVDRFEHRVTVLRRDGGAFVESTLRDNDDYTSPLLPDLRISLQGII